MQMFKIALLSTSLLVTMASCRLYPGAIEPVPSGQTEAEKLAQYPDIEERARISEMRTILMGHHQHVGTPSTLQQLTPPALRQVAEAVSELYPQPKGRRLFMDVIDETKKTIPDKKMSFKLMADSDTFDDLTRRLRNVFKIPANIEISYIHAEITPDGISHIDMIEPDIYPNSGNVKILDMLRRELQGKLLVTIKRH